MNIVTKTTYGSQVNRSNHVTKTRGSQVTCLTMIRKVTTVNLGKIRLLSLGRLGQVIKQQSSPFVCLSAWVNLQSGNQGHHISQDYLCEYNYCNEGSVVTNVNRVTMKKANKGTGLTKAIIET
jgi:hypothetical protein